MLDYSDDALSEDRIELDNQLQVSGICHLYSLLLHILHQDVFSYSWLLYHRLQETFNQSIELSLAAGVYNA
jgi:hypothetical protein